MTEQERMRQAVVFPVKADGQAVIVCPQCGARTKLDVSRFRKRTIPLPYTCSCGQTFPCCFDFSSRAKGASAANLEDLPVVDIASVEAPVESKGSSTPPPPQKARPSGRSTQVVLPDTASAGGGQPTVLTVPVEKNGRARIVCPHCGRSKTVSIGINQLTGKSISVACGCGQSFSCRFLAKKRIEASGKRNVYFPLLKGELAGQRALVFHVDSQGEATIICPECENFKVVMPSKDDTLNNVCGFHCQCGATFPFRVDFRRAYRKPVDLDGTYYHLRQKEKGEMRVTNLSLGGVALYVEGEALDGVHGFEVGDQLELFFFLDDAMHSEINRRVEVRTISGPAVGCRFADNKLHDKALGFYLMA